MKIKYVLEKGKNNELIIKEFSALDKKNNEMYTLLCEEQCEGDVIESAVSSGEQAIISTIRSLNMYPPSAYTGKLAESVMGMYGPEKRDSAEIYFDDYDMLTTALKAKDVLEDIEEDIEDDSVDLDELLEDGDDIKNIKTTIQVADEEAIDIEKDDNTVLKT